MTPEQITKSHERDHKIRQGLAKAIQDHKRFVSEEDRHLAHLIYDAEDIKTYDVEPGDDVVYGVAEVWTNTTGGSTEHASFAVPIDNLNEYL